MSSSLFVSVIRNVLQEFEQLCKVKKAERKAGKALVTAAQAGDATEP